MMENLEKQISEKSEINGIRLLEKFHDFDGLRSGFVSISQFVRILSGELNVKLTDDQIAYLSEKYCDGINDKINYQKFYQSLPSKSPPCEYFGTSRTENQLNSQSEKAITEIISRIVRYYETNGFNVYQTFQDFNIHNIGRITESQFYRAFQKPADLKEYELALIVSKYRNKEDPTLINYMNFCHDVAAVTDRMYNKTIPETTKTVVKQVPLETPSISSVVDKIKIKLFLNRIKAKEFFFDFDKLRSGVITKAQFKSALYRTCGKELGLTENDLEHVAFLYKFPSAEDKVNYTLFCSEMNNAFINPDLETNPTSIVYRPSPGELSWKPSQNLTEKEELIIKEITDRIAEKVLRMRLPLNVYFKDFDMGILQSCLMTQSRFDRSLENFGLAVNQIERNLLYKKYKDDVSGWIHYRNFLIDVDKSYNNLTGKIQNLEQTKSSQYQQKDEIVDFESLIKRMKMIVNKRQIRIKDFFQEFDELRHGVVTRDQFRRLLSQLGFSKLGAMDISDKEFDCLYEKYATSDSRFICWTKFENDMNFDSRLESNGKETNGDGNEKDLNSQKIPFCNIGNNYDYRMLNETFEKINKDVRQRGLNVRFVFQDFDRLNSGYITRGQFSRCLSLLDIKVSQCEQNLLEIALCNSKGFNYNEFLSRIEPIVHPKYMYPELLEAKNATNKEKCNENYTPSSLKDTILEIRLLIESRNIRISEFMEKFDKLNHGIISKSEFCRGLDSSNIKLNSNQLASILTTYQNPTSQDMINYRRFSHDVEYGPENDFLEANPLSSSAREYQRPSTFTLTDSQRENVDKFLLTMSNLVRQRRLDLVPMFKDFDVNNFGSISRSQFDRSLSLLGLSPILCRDTQEIIQKMFGKKVGGREDIDYVGFCEKINQMAGFCPT